jgi:acylphosphatase
MTGAGLPQELRAVVRGRVQGVGFRWFVTRCAERGGLAGRVRNLPDGGVEVLAQGPRDALDQLLDDLRRGPAAARVDDVEAGIAAVTSSIDGWSIG